MTDNETHNPLVHVRFAPSPTGRFHIGSARTALFNWLFAKQCGGSFILRLEDTDTARSKKEFEKDIIENLKWLGIDWDEQYKQSERTQIYADHLKRLIKEGSVYRCFCSKETLEEKRNAMQKEGKAPIYDKTCRDLSAEDIDAHLKNDDPYVIRLKTREGNITFSDMIRKDVSFDTEGIGDIIIARSENDPLYNFTVVVDDALMNITHVIRGEDHISNTPKQILIAEALGFDRPIYAHIPMILNEDRSKMSKRFSNVAVSDYRASGYLPEAMINFLALLGWHPHDDEEILSKEKLIKEFDITRVQKGGAVFDTNKLNWVNSEYIKNIPDETFAENAREFIPEGWKLNSAMIAISKERISTFSELKEYTQFFFELPTYPKEMLAWKGGDEATTKNNLSLTLEALNNFDTSVYTDESRLSEELLAFIDSHSKSKGEILWPLRVALSGQEKSPSPFEILIALGKEESLRRVTDAISRYE